MRNPRRNSTYFARILRLFCLRRVRRDYRNRMRKTSGRRVCTTQSVLPIAVRRICAVVELFLAVLLCVAGICARIFRDFPKDSDYPRIFRRFLLRISVRTQLRRRMQRPFGDRVVQHFSVLFADVVRDPDRMQRRTVVPIQVLAARQSEPNLSGVAAQIRNRFAVRLGRMRMRDISVYRTFADDRKMDLILISPNHRRSNDPGMKKGSLSTP